MIGEVGYLAPDALQASLLFRVVCQRHQKERAVVLRSDEPFGGWGRVFGGDAVVASAAPDRLPHGRRWSAFGARATGQRTSSGRACRPGHGRTGAPSRSNWRVNFG